MCENNYTFLYIDEVVWMKYFISGSINMHVPVLYNTLYHISNKQLFNNCKVKIALYIIQI